MLTPLTPTSDHRPLKPTRLRTWRSRLKRLWSSTLNFPNRHPFISCVVVILVSNIAGTVFNILYNQNLIIDRIKEEQQNAFYNVLWPYNFLAYTYGSAVLWYLLRPLSRCLLDLRAGRSVSSDFLEKCRRRIVNLPYNLVWLNLAGWTPGAVVFPLGICLIGGWNRWEFVWSHFLISFAVSALLTTTQTFFLLESFLMGFVYREFFADGVRPADMPGAKLISFRVRLWLLWLTLAVAPLIALLVVALEIAYQPPDVRHGLRRLAGWVAAAGIASTGFVSAFVIRALVNWMRRHAAATGEIARGNFTVRIPDQRPDEWGKLTDRFNDMAAALEEGRHVRDTMGQLFNPAVRDLILKRYTGLGGKEEEVTVLFADIRGFTRRIAGVAPDKAVELLNRFLTLAVSSIETEGGVVNKFLGDGLMALFGAPLPQVDHADVALRTALDFLRRLKTFNAVLAGEGQAPLVVGIGIHTGPALVGCIGAAMTDDDGQTRYRMELTAIGETVNLAQRLEQMTKIHGGPILLSEQTRQQLRHPVPLIDLGCQAVPGAEGTLCVFRVAADVS